MRPLGSSLLAALPLVAKVTATVHHLVSANRFDSPALHSIEFDDESNELRLVDTFDAEVPHVWISFSPDKRSIYGSSMEETRLASYNASTLEITGVAVTSGTCEGRTSAYNIATPGDPQRVLSVSYGVGDGCGMSIGINEDGSFAEVENSWVYGDVSSAHGLAIIEVEGRQLLYTADMGLHSIWVHEIVGDGGVEALQMVETPGDGAKPRHLVAHPNGEYLYINLEATNSLGVLKMNELGLIVEEENASTFSLLPDDADADNSQYWSAAVILSPNSRYLWLTTRGRGNNSGYLSCFLLTEQGSVVKKLFTLPTDSSGTISSSITTAPWGDEYVVLTDAPGGYLEIWKLDGPSEGNDGVEYETAVVVARLDIESGTCCGNALWLD